MHRSRPGEQCREGERSTCWVACSPPSGVETALGSCSRGWQWVQSWAWWALGSWGSRAWGKVRGCELSIPSDSRPQCFRQVRRESWKRGLHIAGETLAFFFREHLLLEGTPTVCTGSRAPQVGWMPFGLRSGPAPPPPDAPSQTLLSASLHFHLRDCIHSTSSCEI